MSLKRSQELAASSFTAPLDGLVELRTELVRRARAAEVAGQSAVNTAHHYAIRSLSEMISAARAAGKAERDRNVVMDRAAARQLHRMATDLDDNAAALDEQASAASALAERKLRHEARTSEAEAGRLWYALTVFMEHAGLGAEDLTEDTPAERMRGAGRVKRRPPDR